MKQLKSYTIAGLFFVLIIGTLSHFFYEWSGNNFIIGLFSPVNESVWEHMKLVFYPMLLYSAFAAYKLNNTYPEINSALAFGILSGSFLVPVLFYTYTGILGKRYSVIDILIFIISVIAAFYVSYRFTLSVRIKNYSSVLWAVVFLMIIVFILFSYNPPELELFNSK